MTKPGLDPFLADFPKERKGKKTGVVCHASSVTSPLVHISDALTQQRCGRVCAVFEPQRGTFPEERS